MCHSMPVRDATRRESPDGHVLYVEELRKHLGIYTDAGESSSSTDTIAARPEVLLFGHNMHDDFQKMQKDGIDIQQFLHYSGCYDTQVVIEDTGVRMGKSLSDLMSHYGLAELEWMKPGCPKIPAKRVFIGSHCAGNDSIATLGGGIAQALDLSLVTSSHQNYENLPDDWFEKPLQGMNTNMILLAYDTEGVETPKYKPKILNRTSEHGFAWMRIADIAHIAPGKHGENWRPFYHARHWINYDFRNFANWYYCVGNPNGFWPEYGESQYYRVSECPAPFHMLFEQLASGTAGAVEGLATVREVTELLEQTTLEEKTPAVRGNMPKSRGKNPALRGNKGNGPRFGDRMALDGENVTRKQGNGPRFGDRMALDGENVTRKQGNGPRFGDRMALDGENVTREQGNGPNFNGSTALGRVNAVRNMGNGPNFSDGMDLVERQGAKNKGSGPSWAQVVRDTPSRDSK